LSIISPVHILFVAVVALLVLGPRRSREAVRTIAGGVRQLREQFAAAAAARGRERPSEPEA